MRTQHRPKEAKPKRSVKLRAEMVRPPIKRFNSWPNFYGRIIARHGESDGFLVIAAMCGGAIDCIEGAFSGYMNMLVTNGLLKVEGEYRTNPKGYRAFKRYALTDKSRDTAYALACAWEMGIGR
jgi:hypothetical protein